MALSGSMRDFGLSEIFQLIGHQKKSGTLSISDKKRSVEILFEHGAIVGARHEPGQDLYDLAGTLVRSGIIGEEQRQAAQAEAQQTLAPLPQVLLNSGVVDLATLKETISLVNLEIIYSLFLWKDGDYSFDQGAGGPPPSKWTEPIASEGVLMDGYRIKDEWPLIEQSIPSLHSSIEPLAGDFPADKKKYTPDHKKVYNLVDGSRTAMDLVFLSRMGMFETLKILRDLVEQGRISVGSAKRAAAADSTTVMLKGALLATLAVGLLAVGLGVWRNVERRYYPDKNDPGVVARERLWTLYKADRVRQAAIVYASLRGQTPAGESDLVSEGLVSSGDIQTLWGRISYQPGAGGKPGVIVAPAPAD